MTSSSLFDLDLPVVKEGNEPEPATAPSYETLLEHARFLLDAGLAAERQPVSEPFVLD